MERNDLKLFKAMGGETTSRILRLLMGGEYCACEIPRRIGRTQSNTSMQLTKLQTWGLIQSRRSGKMVLYTLKDKRIYKLFKVIL